MNANTGLRIEIVELTTEAESERVRLRQELKKLKVSAVLQKKTVTRLRSTVQSPKIYIESISSEKEILQKGRNDTEFKHDGAKAWEALLAARNS